jgi:hypothetical protein
MGRECDLGASQPGLSASLSGLPYPGRPSSHLPCTRTRRARRGSARQRRSHPSGRGGERRWCGSWLLGYNAGWPRTTLSRPALPVPPLAQRNPAGMVQPTGRRRPIKSDGPDCRPLRKSASPKTLVRPAARVGDRGEGVKGASDLNPSRRASAAPASAWRRVRPGGRSPRSRTRRRWRPPA